MHARINDAPPRPWQENNFSRDVGYVRRERCSEVNHDGMIQSGIPEAGLSCITLGDALS
jgi:hypothetical protein